MNDNNINIEHSSNEPNIPGKSSQKSIFGLTWFQHFNHCQIITVNFYSFIGQYVGPYFERYHHIQDFKLSDMKFHDLFLFICLFGVLCRFQHCTGHITMGSWKGRETSTYSSLGFCTVNYWPTASNYQLSHLRPWWGLNPGRRGGRRECYHSATVAPWSFMNPEGKGNAYTILQNHAPKPDKEASRLTSWCINLLS